MVEAQGKYFSWFRVVCVCVRLWTKMTQQIRILLLILPIFLVGDGCHRSGRHLIMPVAQERSAQEIMMGFKNDFDMNVHFGLRKMGINRQTGESIFYFM